MGLEQTLSDTLTQAIRDRDARTADVVRMLKTRLQERRTAKGFSGQIDDALVLDVIGAYRKQLQKAIAEYEKVGERGAAHASGRRAPHSEQKRRPSRFGVRHWGHCITRSYGALSPSGALRRRA